jgi:uncharacterized protein YkwD
VGALAAGQATAVGVPAGPPDGCAGAGLRPSTVNARAVEAAVVCLINRVRARHRLRPLHANRYLGQVARGQAARMLSWNYFADVRPTGQTPARLIAASRYPARARPLATGENIAWGSGVDATPTSIVTAWMESPSHRAILLGGAYRDAGAGAEPALPSFLQSGELGAVYVVELGARAVARTARRR